MRKLIPLVAALLVVTAAPASAATHRVDRCARYGGDTLRHTALVRVYQSGDAHACWKPTGSRIFLWVEDEYDTGGVRAIRGAFVAYDLQSYPTCKADCPPGVTGTSDTKVVNVRTRRRRDLGVLATRLVLANSGAVAWLEGSSGSYRLWLWDRHGRRQLDTGDIAPRSLKLSGHFVRWTSAGQAKSARFH